jgi:hypothetical protein
MSRSARHSATERNDALRRGALLALHDVELDALAFGQRLEACFWIAEWCTKQSFVPSSGVMKPKPLVSLNHLTVPVIRMGKLRWM